MFSRPNKTLRLRCCLVLMLLCCLARTTEAATPKFWQLEGVHPSEPTDALSVSDDGTRILAFRSTRQPPLNREYVVWRVPENTFESLPIDGPTPSLASTISPDGSGCIVYANTPNGSEAQWWSAGEMTVLRPLFPGTWAGGEQILPNGRGVVGSASSADNSRAEAVFWDESGTPTRLNEVSGYDAWSTATAASADGSIIVGATGSSAALWDVDRNLTLLGTLPGDVFSSASSVSADGSIVVGYSVPGDGTVAVEPFRWTSETGMQSLRQFPGKPRTLALDISADGTVIVGSAEDARTGVGTAIVMFDGKHWLDLQEYLVEKHGLGEELDGWNLNYARAVSADGRTIIGFGFGPEGENRGWAVTLPEPAGSQLLLIFLGLGGGAWGWRRLREMRRPGTSVFPG